MNIGIICNVVIDLDGIQFHPFEKSLQFYCNHLHQAKYYSQHLYITMDREEMNRDQAPRRLRQQNGVQSPDPVPHKKRKTEEYVQKAINDGSTVRKTYVDKGSDINKTRQNSKIPSNSDSSMSFQRFQARACSYESSNDHEQMMKVQANQESSESKLSRQRSKDSKSSKENKKKKKKQRKSLEEKNLDSDIKQEQKKQESNNFIDKKKKKIQMQQQKPKMEEKGDSKEISSKKKSSTNKSKADSPNSKGKPVIGQPTSHRDKNLIVTRDVDFVPVDIYFSRRDEAKVLEHNKVFYSVTLSQSNLAKDDNKFFVIQILQIDQSPNDQYYLFTRWGRVGVTGQIFQNGPHNKRQAIRQYNSKSQSKVKSGGYKIVEVAYDQQGNVESQQIDQYLHRQNSTLPSAVQQLVKLIFDRRMMENHMKEIGYDQKRSPLGLIAKTSLDKGYLALDKIMKIIKGQIIVDSQPQKRKLLNEYSSEFYSVIPHDFGYMNMQAFVLNSEQKVKQKLQMLSSLSQIQIYANLMKQKMGSLQMSDLDIKYMKLKCDITPLQMDTQMYQVINKYVQNTHGKTHDKYAIEVLGIFNLKREEQEHRYKQEIGNKMLLWHGSRLTNYVGILSQGLKIAPYEAPATGYMFGKGIYFADIVSKSANYCLPKDNTVGLMLLCQVALGQMNDKDRADYNAHNLPTDKHSTRGVGKNAPSSGQMVDGVWIPNGPLLATGIQTTSLQYNEYVVYRRDQIKCRYIVYVKFHFRA